MKLYPVDVTDPPATIFALAKIELPASTFAVAYTVLLTFISHLTYAYEALTWDALRVDKLRGSVITVVDEIVGFPPTLVMVIPVPAVRFGVRSQVRVVMSASVIVAVPVTDKSASILILEAFNWETFNGSVTYPVDAMVGIPPTDVMVIPVPAVRFGVRSHVRVEILAFVICAVPLNIDRVGSAAVTKSGRRSMPFRDRLELNSIVVAFCVAEKSINKLFG